MFFTRSSIFIPISATIPSRLHLFHVLAKLSSPIYYNTSFLRKTRFPILSFIILSKTRHPFINDSRNISPT